MASSYTTSYGIEKIGSGEQSGAWGTTTNHNLDLLDRIAAYTSVALSGTTHTLTVREASPGSGTENLQDGMYRVIKFTGALGANNTVTIAPNTTKAFFFIHNATTDSGSSGPYSVILTQGSGANITVANGKNAIIYCDGGGSGAIVVDAVSNLALATVTASGDVTSAGTVNVTGDTAAGDDASMGYTSAEGLILTGQGSTNDVTIKNDADADVITIATGGTNVDIVGDVTASTINADGDTAASDNAAMGYTAAEGLILTGQGSTNDVTIKNDADADVITIATGGTNVAIAGDLTISGDDLFMATNTSGAALIADGTNFNPVVISGDISINTSGVAAIGSAVIVEADIADNAVTLAKMAGGTDGNIISFDASGNPVAVATGNDGQVLTSAGAGAVCAFEDAAGGAWTLIGTVVASDDATITITGLDSTYDSYGIALSDLHPVTDNVQPYMRFGTSSGIFSGSGDYTWGCNTVTLDGGTTAVSCQTSAADSKINLLRAAANGVGNDAGETFGAMLFIHTPGDSTGYSSMSGNGVSNDLTPQESVMCSMWSATQDVVTLDRVQFYFSSGNVETGRMTVWGISHA